MDRVTSLRVVVVIDATCQRPLNMAVLARELPADSQVIAAVLWPPATLTLSARLLAWRYRHRALVTEDLVGSVRAAVRQVNPAGRLTVAGQGFSYPRGASPRARRVAGAIARVCVLYRARFVVLSDQPRSLVTATVRQLVRSELPTDVVMAVTDLLTAPPPDITGDARDP